ncbi:adenosylcobalamin/alpha-ribazole phosphatase [Enterobacteriaceae bacterium ESL0689]|nr:adenosylcobalamin/alpha-ribazole phosphatase [Enterobacteriaceae bacterium ESL0689]
MRLWLVRHGETEANVAGLYCGHSPTPLTAHGIRQAQTVGQCLQSVPFDYVFCSELARTQHTARLLLGDRPVACQIHPELNEIFFGDWEMRHYQDLQREDAANYAAWCADWQHATPPQGEGFQHFARRITTFADKLAQYQDIHHLLIVGHQGGLSLLIAQLLGLPAAAMWHFPIMHGAWSALDLQPDFTTLRVLNSQASWQREE